MLKVKPILVKLPSSRYTNHVNIKSKKHVKVKNPVLIGAPGNCQDAGMNGHPKTRYSNKVKYKFHNIIDIKSVN